VDVITLPLSFAGIRREPEDTLGLFDQINSSEREREKERKHVCVFIRKREIERERETFFLFPFLSHLCVISCESTGGMENTESSLCTGSGIPARL